MASVLNKVSERQPYPFARRMSQIGVSAVREILRVTERPEIISFAGGLPAPELFPVEALARAHADVFASAGAAAMQYSTTEGWGPLREWVADRMRQKGIDAEAGRVLITAGSQQGIYLTGQVFLNPGDAVVVENPCYVAALQVFNGCEASFLTVDSDEDGMRVDQLESLLKRSRPKLIYVVPNFHNPKGTTLSLERREKLVALAHRYGVPILEDDPYGELRYRGDHLPPLAALDREGMVIYLNTFSKTLSPGMRIGWAHASKEVLRAIITAKQPADLHTGTIQQRAAARMLESFDYDGHVARICNLYGERCEQMLRSMEKRFPEEIYWTRPEGGMFLWVELPGQIAGEELLEEALEQRVAFVPGACFFAKDAPRHFIRLNFSNSSPEKIEEGIQRIGQALNRRLA